MLTATTTAGNVVVPGAGLVTVDVAGPSTTTYTATGPIATTGVPAVTLTSTGGALSFTPVATSAPVNITTTGGNAANALTLNSAGQAATVTAGNVATSGTNSFGVLANGGTDLTLTTGTITTTGATSTAIDAGNQTGNIAITAGNITATGRGLRTNSTGGTNTIVVGNLVSGDRGILANGTTVSVTTGNVTTSTNGGTTPGGYGIAAQSSAGNSTVRTGVVNVVNGAGIIASTLGATGNASVSGCPSVTTAGNNATAVSSQTNGAGSITINCGALSTTGGNSNGVYATSNGGNIVTNITSATTAGLGSYGITNATAGAGTVTTNAGVITTTGDGGTGLYLRTGTGAIDAGYGNITTSGVAIGGNSASALDIASTGTINLRGSGTTLRTNGAGTTAAVVTGAGVTGNLGNVTTTGAGAQGAIITSTAPINLTIGTVATTGNGVTVNAGANAVTLTTGAVTATGAGATGTVINATGPVIFTGGTQTANGANALRITGGAGAITAAVAGAATTGTGDAVAITGTGPVTLTSSGPITTTGTGANGIAITTTATIGITAGTISTTGANSRGIVANGGAGVTIAAAGVTATGGSSAIIANSAAGPVAVTLSGTNASSGANGVNLTAATTANLALTSGSLTGGTNGALITSGTGTTVTNAGTISGNTTALTITGGAATINNSGTITGNVLLTANADTVNNSGTFNANSNSDFGAGNDVFNNSGTFRALGIASTAGTVTLTGLESFNNTGLVDLRNGHAGDVLVLPGTYTGGGAAQLGLDVNIGAATNAADQLRVGGAATGTTVVSLNLLNTAPAVLSSATGITLVQAGAGSIASAFTINSANVDHGLIQYGIVYNPTAFSYNLVAAPTAAAYRTALFAQSARNLWLQSGDAWTAHMRELRDNLAANGPGSAGGRVWGQAIGQVEQRTDSVNYAFNGITTAANMGYKQDYFGGQLGVDFGAPAGAGAFAFGVTGGYLSSDLTFASSADRITFDTVNGGVYANYASGMFFVNALGKYDYYWANNVGVSGGYNVRTRGAVYGGKGEVGFRVGTTLWIEPSASASYTHSDFHDFGVASGTFSFNDQDGVRGKGGARVGYTADVGPAKLTVYGGGNYVHEFQGRDQVAFTSGGQVAVFGAPKLRDYGEGTLGVNIGSQHGMVSGFFEGRYADGGDYQGYGGRAGMRVRF